MKTQNTDPKKLQEYIRSSHFREKIYLISYPRSGNTFTRYMLEILTGYESLGYPAGGPGGTHDLMVSNNKVAGLIGQGRTVNESGLIVKRHQWTTSKGSTAILLLRDPIDSFLRHKGPGEPGYDQLNEWLSGNDKVHGYFFKNVQSYIDYSGSKLVVHYEDMATRPQEYFTQLLNFVDNPVTTTKQFMEKYNEHFAACRAHYWGGSKSSGKTATAYSSKISPELKKRMWNRIEECTSAEVYALLHDRYGITT